MSDTQLKGTFAAALAAYQLHNKPKTTAQLGIEMGIPEDYNRHNNKGKIENEDGKTQ